ncbi:hypothetical protein HF086_005378 [Spodoptera exigua]|uniref:Uncharacterized protein n=1 Tax=Spodoptera exigua TaxID=7107 RepID=A0A922SNT1_SPOEX|nr:hypothetical protein HF086_005378 [Spodoptera exigua]
MLDSEDLFNFIPCPPKEPNAGESSKLNLKRKRGTSSAPQKRQQVQVYSYTKTRAQNISASSRTIKIEIYEADNQPKKACECRANKAQIDNPFWLCEEDSPQPSTAANSSSKKKAEPVKRAKKSQKKKFLPVKNPFAGESDSDSDTIKLAEDTTPPAIKRKKIAVFPDSEIDNPFWLCEEDSPQPSTAANSSSKKKAEPVKRAKKSQKKKVLPVKNPFAGESDSDSDTIKLAEDTTTTSYQTKENCCFS